MSNSQTSFDSPHFSIYTLADGVHVAIAKNGGAAIANAGIIDLGDQTVIFDTFMTLQAAQGLALAARHLTGRKAETIINSHYHNDHTWGNQVFSSQAKIVSTSQTRELLQTKGVEELNWARSESKQRLEEFQNQYEKAESDQERQEARMWIGYYQGLVDNLPRTRLRLPDVTFENRMSIHGSSRSFHLLPFENSHTGNDLILHMPKDGIIFMSDLLFVGCHPFLAESDVDQLLDSLQQIRTLEAEFYVPGHGQVGSKKDLDLMVEYVSMCRNKAQDLASKRKTSPEEISAEALPGQFASWELPRFFQINLQALCKKYAGDA